MTALLGRAVVIRGITGSAVTAMSLASRVLTLLLLVPAARALSVADFGIFSLVLGLATAAANVVGSAPADLTATAASTAPERTRRRVLLAVIVLTVLSAAAVLGGLVVERSAAIALSGVAMGTSTIAPVMAMNVLRGLDRPVLGAALAYVAVPLARAAAATAALELGADLVGVLFSIGAVGVAVGAATIAALVRVRPASDPGSEASTSAGSDRPASRAGLALIAGASVSTAWMALGQSGNLALTTVAGAAALAAFVPTSRLCESLTAIGIGYKSAANRSLQATRVGALRPRPVLVLLAALTATAVVLFAVAPWAVPAVFGPELRFLPAVAVPLVVTAAVSSLIAVKIQLLFAARRHVRIVVASLGASAASVALAVPGAVLWQTEGIAMAMAASVSVWLFALVVRIPRKQVSPC